VLCAVVVLELAGRHTTVFPGGGIVVARRGIMLEVPIHALMVG
jgi:hypothetical protein